MKRHFVFNTEWYEIIRECSTIIKGEVFTAVMEYATTGQEITVSPEATVIFKFIKREIDRREMRRKAAESRRISKARLQHPAATAKQETVKSDSLQPQPAVTSDNASSHAGKTTQQRRKPRLNINDHFSMPENTFPRKELTQEKKAAIGQLMTALSNLACARQ